MGADDSTTPNDMLQGPVFGGPNSPDTWATIICILIILTLGSLACGTGIGGGSVYIPMFALLYGLTTKEAAPLTKIAVLGGSIGSLFFICWKHHPNAPRRPLVDYEVATFMQAGLYLGVTIGVICNVLLSDIVVLIFFEIILALTGYRTLRKARIMYKRETAEFVSSEARLDLSLKSNSSLEGSVRDPSNRAKRDMHHFLDQHGLGSMKQALGDNGVYSLYDLEDDHRVNNEFLVNRIKMTPAEVQYLRDALQRLRLEAAVPMLPSTDSDLIEEAQGARPRSRHNRKQEISESQPPESPLVSPHPVFEHHPNGDGDAASTFDTGTVIVNLELQKFNDGIAVQFPRWAYGLTLFMVVYTFVYAWVKADYLNPCYSNVGVYYLWLVSPFLVLGGCSLGVGYYLSRLHDKRNALGYQYLGTDVQWTTRMQCIVMLVSVMAGFASGLLGLGGGVIIGPLFVEMGMEAHVAAATCAFIIFWSGLSALVQYYFQGLFVWQWLVAYGVIGALSGQIGLRGVYSMIKTFARPSLMVFVLGFIIMLALVLMTVTSSMNLVADWTTTSEMFAVDTGWTRC